MVRVLGRQIAHCHQIEDDPDGARWAPTASSVSYTHVCQWQSGRLGAFPDGSFTPQVLLSGSFTAPPLDPAWVGLN